ncbi:MAG: LysE family transporter [Reyranella sp.]|nr:LysE family transporter [Reyranella sp.]
MLLSLIVASLLVMGSPGPSTVSVTAVGAAFGLRRSIAYTSGLVAGTVAVLLAVATGVVAVLLAEPRLAPVLLAASAAYILYLAFRIATAPPLSTHDGTVAAPSFVGGVLLAIANPKAYVAIAAVFAGSTLAPVPKIAVLSGMVVLIHVAWLLAGAAFSRVFHDPVWSRRVNIAFAAALVATTAYAVM